MKRLLSRLPDAEAPPHTQAFYPPLNFVLTSLITPPLGDAIPRAPGPTLPLLTPCRQEYEGGILPATPPARPQGLISRVCSPEQTLALGTALVALCQFICTYIYVKHFLPALCQLFHIFQLPFQFEMMDCPHLQVKEPFSRRCGGSAAVQRPAPCGICRTGSRKHLLRSFIFLPSSPQFVSAEPFAGNSR